VKVPSPGAAPSGIVTFLEKVPSGAMENVPKLTVELAASVNVRLLPHSRKGMPNPLPWTWTEVPGGPRGGSTWIEAAQAASGRPGRTLSVNVRLFTDEIA
jgi:hypothetical protein